MLTGSLCYDDMTLGTPIATCTNTRISHSNMMPSHSEHPISFTVQLNHIQSCCEYQLLETVEHCIVHDALFNSIQFHAIQFNYITFLVLGTLQGFRLFDTAHTYITWEQQKTSTRCAHPESPRLASHPSNINMQSDRSSFAITAYRTSSQWHS